MRGGNGVLSGCVVRGEDHPAYRGKLLEVCSIGGGGTALGRGERGLQLVHRVPFQLGDQVARGAVQGRDATAEGVAAQSRQPTDQWNVSLVVVPVESLGVGWRLVQGEEAGRHRALRYWVRTAAPACSADWVSR